MRFVFFELRLQLFWMLFSILLNGTKLGYSQLEGSTAKCDEEGAIIEIPNISIDPCISCKCQRGEVVCTQETCKSLEGCHVILQELFNSGKCCGECRGCMYRGRSYSSGETWIDPEDKCKQLHCQAGVITKSKIRCHVTCDNPVMRDGECCPKCPTCQMRGRTYLEGDIFQSPDDPCAKCVCKDRMTSCSRSACPVLNCPDAYVAAQVGQCCPVCMERRKVFDWGKRGCLFRGEFVGKNKMTLPDSCTQCTCMNGTMVCNRRVCPSILCPPSHVTFLEGECCPVCVRPKKGCKYQNQRYKHGAEWADDVCTNCTCSDGTVRCHVEQCMNTLSCSKNRRLQFVADKCCPICVEEPAVCAVFGDPHYRTFDGFHLNFQGSCSYILAQDCVSGNFSVRVRNTARLTNDFAWTKGVTVVVGDDKVALRQKLQVRVNKQEVILPHVIDDVMTITLVAGSIILETENGLKVVWDGDSYLEVIVLPSYKSAMCGLCGNYNDKPNDDLIGKDGALYIDPEAFGDTWSTGGRRCRRKESEKRQVSPCQRSRRKRQRAEKACSILYSVSLVDCHGIIRVDPYFRSCVLDVCDCPKRRHCACEALVAYTRACQRKGIASTWDLTAICSKTHCPKGGYFTSCSNANCPETCDSSSQTSDNCDLPCVPGCQCPKDTVLHKDSCIPKEKCPSSNNNDIHISHNDNSSKNNGENAGNSER